MASFFRSISLKIFGVAAGLLAIMIATALWSGFLTQQVHLQFRTFNEALFPMTLRIAELRAVVIAETVPLDRTGGQCRAQLDALAAKAGALAGEAESLRANGAKLAQLERNKLELARLEPMLAELAGHQTHLAALLRAACDTDDPAADAAARTQAGEVVARAEAINAEIDGFVLEGATIVGDNQDAARRATLAMIGAAGLVGLMLAWVIARGMTRPIARLQAGARAVGEGQLDTEVPITSKDEIADVTRAFNAMVSELREKERIKETFGQYVDPRVVADLMAAGSDRSTTGEKQVATLFFSDIAGFTALSERLAPSTLVNLINAYFSEMSGAIRDRSGVIDKYIGDAIMAFWVPPFADATTQAADACAAALEQFARLERFAARVPDLIGMRRDLPRIDIRVGLATGEVVVGSIGSEQARSFTVMGDTVNFGSRLEGANKAYGTRILIDGATRDAADGAVETREIDLVTVVGRQEPLRVFELAAMAGELPAERRRLFDLYEAALAPYRGGDWAAAAKGFEAALKLDAGDGPAQAMLARIKASKLKASAGWAGVSTLTEK
ncbi:adenylate/guanylate cyclase domain-containing protein [Sphingoaurantiacus capsulatus]|uniref:Adenylate/guanylate cyclase domain-containing protein n=1 Tax=Sphingoaurantiacus capsulatus TaxID=1771310 RepID=A0ABV7XEA5_9SPHN